MSVNLDYPTDRYNYCRLHFKNTGPFFFYSWNSLLFWGSHRIFFFFQKRGLNPCFSAGGFNVTFFEKGRNRKEQTRKRPQQQTNHNSNNISGWGGESCQRGLGQVEGLAEQQRQTWLSVSPFIHQHLKRGTKQLGSVCWDCPFIPLTAGVYKNTKVTCVFL